jgi:ubiquinone/menaquinone biosynthesis C-methylase UbiE
MRRGGRILDAGCGTGEWVEFLCRRGYLCEGLDYSQELVHRIRQVYPKRTWTYGRTQALPYPDGTFDGIISWGVIEHDPRGPMTQLREYRRVLKPGGHIIVTVPYDSESMRHASAMLFPKTNNGKFFQFFYTPDELTTIGCDAGFSILESAPVKEASVELVATRWYARTHGKDMMFRTLGRLFRWGRMPGPPGMIYAIGRRLVNPL